MSWFDQDYFDKLCLWIRKADNGEYQIKDLSKDDVEFKKHLYWYKKNNKDHREVWIDGSTFELRDIYYKGIMNIGVLPEEIRIQRLNRLFKDHGKN